jgi:hypothetical protein
MKINWGYRVAILYIGFAGLIIYFVTRSMNEKIDLVTKDYYAQELKYQDKIESSNRNNSLDQPLSIEMTDAGIVVKFPNDMEGKKITGSILLFRPSDNTKDKTIAITPNTKFEQLIPNTELAKGMYRVKVEYQTDGVDYYSEKQIVVR